MKYLTKKRWAGVRTGDGGANAAARGKALRAYREQLETMHPRRQPREAWTLRYTAIRRIVVDFPSKAPLSYQDGEGFGDVGCHELTDCGGGFFRHEILFSSGATLLFEFRDVDVQGRAR
jgi:hypothetical protein